VVFGPLNGNSDVWAEWWGAKGDLVKTNNEVAYNQAWFFLLQTVNSIGYGGTINLDRGDFLKSGSSYHSDQISYRGRDNFYTLLQANSGTWNGDNNMLRSQSAVPVIFTAAPNAAATSATLTVGYGDITDAAVTIVFFSVDGTACEAHTASVTAGNTSVTWTGGLAKNCTINAAVLTKRPIFNNNIFNLRLNAGDIAAITQVNYAPSWQQMSGFDSCYIENYRQWAVFLEWGYGGAAQLTFRRTWMLSSPNCVSGSASIKLGGTNGLGGSNGKFKLNLEEIQMGSATAPLTFANKIAPALTFTGAPASAATSATLNATWTGTTGAYLVWFVETAGGANELRSVTLTNSATTATWTGGLAANCNATTSAAPSTSLSGALNANWAYPTGVWNVLFSDGEARNVTLTNGATTATWTSNITNAVGVTAATTAVSPNSQGVVASNSRIAINCNNVHFEQCHDAFNLDGATDLVGGPITCDSNATVTNMFTLQTTWTGKLCLLGANKGGVIQYVNDLARAAIQPNAEPFNNLLLWPPGALPGAPQVSYDATHGLLTITQIDSSGGLAINGVAGSNLYTTLNASSGGSEALMHQLNGTLYGRWGVDLASNLVTGSALGDSFIRTVNKAFLVSTNDGAGIQFNLTSGGDIVGTRGISVCKRATAIETRTSNTTVANSTQLTYAIPVAGTYEIDLMVFFYATTAGTNGITANVNYSGTFTAVGSYIDGYFMNGTTTTTGVQPAAISTTTTAVIAGLTISATGSTNSATPCVYRLKGTLIATGTGTLAFAFAQNTSGTNTTNLGVGSFLKVKQLS